MNIGAREGVHEDPLYPLLQNPADVRFSLAVEMKPEWLACMCKGWDEIMLLCHPLQPEGSARSMPATCHMCRYFA